MIDPNKVAKLLSSDTLVRGELGIISKDELMQEGVTEKLGIIIHKDHPNQITVYNMEDNKKFIVLKLAQPITHEQIDSLATYKVDDSPMLEPSIDPEPTMYGKRPTAIRRRADILGKMAQSSTGGGIRTAVGA